MRTLAVLAALFLVGQAFAATPEERYQAAEKQLTPCEYCLGIADTPQDIAALEAIWQAAADWTVDLLNSGRTLDQVRTEFLNRNSARREVAPLDIVEIGSQLYAVSSDTMDSTGTAFIIGKSGGEFAVLWDIRHLPEPYLAQFPMLKAWSAEAATDGCRVRAADDRYRECGPLSGNFRLLPRDGKGRIRFALDATYGQMAETTVGAQLSIWTWDGKKAEPVWAKPYAYNFEDESWVLKCGLLKIRATDWWHTLFACGTCVGRQMDWTIRIRPDGVDDLGMTPVVPELDAFDELAWRIFQKQDARDLASAAVIQRMQTVVSETSAFLKDLMKEDYDPNWLSFGMLGGFEVRKVGGGTELCVVTDDTGFRVRFRRHAGRPFITDLEQLSEGDSKFCHKQAP